MAKVAPPPQVPPPFEPPLADTSPFMLQCFIYLLARNHLPLGAIEAAVQASRARTTPLPPDVIGQYAERIARELVYE